MQEVLVRDVQPDDDQVQPGVQSATAEAQSRADPPPDMIPSERPQLSMGARMDLMAEEGTPYYDVREASTFPFVITKKDPIQYELLGLQDPRVLYEDEHPTFVADNGIIEEQDANGTTYKIDRIKFANYLQNMTIASYKLQQDMQILVWVPKLPHAEQMFRTVCHLQTEVNYMLLPVTFFVQEEHVTPPGVPSWEKCSTMWHNAPNMAMVPYCDWKENQQQFSVVSWTNVPPVWALPRQLVEACQQNVTFGTPMDHIIPVSSGTVTCTTHLAIVAFKACTFIQGLGILNSWTVLDSSDNPSSRKERTYCPIRYMDAANYHTGAEYAKQLTECKVSPDLAHEAVVAVAVQRGATSKSHPACVHADSATTVALGIIVNLKSNVVVHG